MGVTNNQPARITNKERQIIQALEWSDFSNESEPGLYGYIFHDEWDMTVFRGVMSSLSKKKIVSWSEEETGETWGVIDPKFTIIEDDVARMDWDLFEKEV